MPLTRYQIRNEYSLADPELYREADRDDPEALLEGVAMAGLVGVLRQLGDLAEFAAEIFHDLHEEVMATAARGHGLMVRVQQLETDFPSIEKAFLSQTSPSLFFYDPGVEWHPNLRMDQNLITREDLPRFVMDSYEECRGPPRLFLLDKFDVAGAGACLKRYTDPSSFKVESSYSGMSKAEVHREKKTRKAKKKGSRWRNGETPEVLPVSHAKLHQLFMEESVEDYIRDPSRRVKLKRRLNGFPFDSRTGKSYMEKFLKTSTPDHNVRDISINSSPLRLPSNTNEKSGMQTLEISTENPGKELPWRKRSLSSSPDAQKTRQSYSIDKLDKEVDYRILEAGAVREDEYVKGIVADRERKIESSVDGYQSDDIASEVENYMDALANTDSEMDTDSEYRAKKDMHVLNTEHVVMNSDANEELQYLDAHFLDSQSIDNSTATDDGNSSSRKGLSSFSYSDSLSNSAENAASDGDVSANILKSTGSRKAGSVSSDQAAERVVSNGVCTKESSFSLSDSTNLPVNSGIVSTEGESVGLESDETYIAHNNLNNGYFDQEETAACRGDIVPCTSSCSDGPSQTRYDFLPDLSSEKPFVYELDNENSNDLSHSSGMQSENLLDNAVQAEYGEDEHSEVLVDNPSHSVASELETWHPYIKPIGIVSEADDVPPLSGDRETGSITEVHSPQATDITKQLFPGMPETDPTLDSVDMGFHNYEEENLDKATNAADNEEIGQSLDHMHIFGEDAADLELPSDLQNSSDSPSVPAVHQDDATIETVYSEMSVDEAVASTSFDCNGGEGKALPGSPTKLQEESHPIVQDLCANNMEMNEPYSQENFKKSGSQEEVNQQGVALSFIDSVMFSTVSCDESNSEARSNVPDPVAIAAPSRNLQIVDTASGSSSSDLHDQQSELISAQMSNLLNDAEDDQNVKLRDDHFDMASCCDQNDVSTVNELPINSLQTFYASNVPLSFDQHDQLSELERAKLINVVEDIEDDVSSYDCPADLGPPLEQKSDLAGVQNDVASRCAQDSESEYSHAKDAASSLSHHIVELKDPVEQKVEQYDQFAVESLNPDKAVSDPVMELTQSPNQDDASFGFFVPCTSSEPSVLEFLPQFDVSNKAKELSFSTLPSFGHLPEVSQINSDDMPPLPPLPPMQWRIGKVQHASVTSIRDLGENTRGLFPPLLMSTAGDNIQQGHLTAADEITRPSIPFTQLSASQGESSPHSYESLASDMTHSNPLSSQGTNGELDIPTSGRSESTNPFLVPPTVCGVRSEHGFNASEGETAQPSKNPLLSENNIRDAVPETPPKFMPEELDHPSHQSAPERSLKDDKLQDTSVVSEREAINPLETTFSPPMMQAHRPYNVLSCSEEQPTWALSMFASLPPSEDGNPDGNRPTKLPRPRNPLIDAVVAHDKSKLRKVTEQVQSHVGEKIEERDSLLAQIRTKSFNLKPAALTRPSIQGPKTNLKVAAILEKANAIRQAFAGSDDDDADSWSDT